MDTKNNNMTRKEVKKEIKKFLTEQEKEFGDINEMYDEDTFQGYANQLLSKALKLL